MPGLGKGESEAIYGWIGVDPGSGGVEKSKNSALKRGCECGAGNLLSSASQDQVKSTSQLQMWEQEGARASRELVLTASGRNLEEG